MLPHIGQLDKKLTNAMMNLAASESLVMNEGVNSRQVKDSTLHATLLGHAEPQREDAGHGW